MRVSECVCVSEEGGREGGGGGRGADTELKTKTPHVNVGNNMNNGPWTLSIQSIVQMHKMVLQTTKQ